MFDEGREAVRKQESIHNLKGRHGSDSGEGARTRKEENSTSNRARRSGRSSRRKAKI
jgi:hypothetical protein